MTDDHKSPGSSRRKPQRNNNRRPDRSRGRRHANRAGANKKQNGFRTQRPNYREDRMTSRLNEPDLPDDLDIRDLDPLVLQDLRVLSKDNANAVAKHILMAALLMEEDPKLALSHARAAKERAGRVSVVRETCGIAAYKAGEWKEALSELRAARRISGGPGLIAVMADCERGLGRPEKAIELAAEADSKNLDMPMRIELAIVTAGAHQDMGQLDAAVVTLQDMNPDPSRIEPAWARLSYAYADALAAAGQIAQARTWFTHAAEQDVEEFLDAQERLAELG